MYDKFDIINGALVRIGANEIASLDDDTTEGTTARRIYPNTLRDLLSRYRWRFMIGEALLARLSAPPLGGWDAAYQIPTEAEVIESVTVNQHSINFDRIGDQIRCNATVGEQVYLNFTYKVDETRFPGYFCTLLEFELASNLAIPVGDRGDLAEAYEKKSLRHFGLAKNLDAQGRTARRMPTGRFRRARWGTGSYGA